MTSNGKSDTLNLLQLPLKKINEIPHDHETMVQLIDSVVLDLTGNHFSQVPPFIEKLTNLESLKLSFNAIQCTSNISFNHLHLLTVLDLSFNQLSGLTETLCSLTSLQVLLLQHNQICHISDKISQLKSLSYLDLGHNALAALPEEICLLKSLRVLLVEDNLLLQLPKDFHLLEVEQLDVSHNRIWQLPPCIPRMPHLRRLSCQGNPLVRPPLQTALLGVRHIQKFLHEAELSLSQSVDNSPTPTSCSSSSTGSPSKMVSWNLWKSKPSFMTSSCPCGVTSVIPGSDTSYLDEQRRKTVWRDWCQRMGRKFLKFGILQSVEVNNNDNSSRGTSNGNSSEHLHRLDCSTELSPSKPLLESQSVKTRRFDQWQSRATVGRLQEEHEYREAFIQAQKDISHPMEDQPVVTDLTHSRESQRLCKLLMRHLPEAIRASFFPSGELPSCPMELRHALSDLKLIWRWVEHIRPGLLPPWEEELQEVQQLEASKLSLMSNGRGLREEFVVRKRRFQQPVNQPQPIDQDIQETRLRRAESLLLALRTMGVPKVCLCSSADLADGPSLSMWVVLCEGLLVATRLPLFSDVAISVLCVIMLLATSILLFYLPRLGTDT